MKTARSGILVLIHCLDPVFDEFKGREEDGVDDTRPAHGYGKATIHLFFEELYRRRFYLFASGV